MRIILLTAAFALQFGTAAAQTGNQPPVVINACNPITAASKKASIDGFAIASQSQGMHIQFTNESTKTADIVNFGVNSNGSKFVIRDVGKFSPGIEITHRYSNGAGQAFVLPEFITPKIKCKVDSVRFTDGTTWRPGSGSAPAAGGSGNNPLSVSPAHVRVDRGADAQLFMVSSTDKLSAFYERDDCAGIAVVTLGVTGESTAAYSVQPKAAGRCTVAIQDELGNKIAVKITVGP